MDRAIRPSGTEDWASRALRRPSKGGIGKPRRGERPDRILFARTGAARDTRGVEEGELRVGVWWRSNWVGIGVGVEGGMEVGVGDERGTRGMRGMGGQRADKGRTKSG